MVNIQSNIIIKQSDFPFAVRYLEHYRLTKNLMTAAGISLDTLAKNIPPSLEILK